MTLKSARGRWGTFQRFAGVAPAMLAAMLWSPAASFADEGGVSIWIPGFYGSFAALPVEPGPSFATIYYHTSVDAGGDRAFPRGGRIEAGLDADADLVFLAPSYAFETPVFGAQAAVSLAVAAGHSKGSIDATLTGPGGNVISGSRTDTVSGFGDAVAIGSLKWNRGVNNFMTYAAVALPVGSYDPDRLANLSGNHWAIDAGGGYTYFNPQTGREFSAVLGFTYNFENPDTDYQNGVDAHIDWAASQFLNEHLHVGVVGYAYQQLSGDSGEGATLGDFKSRVFGIGPQIGYKFNVSDKVDGYLNLKGYWEFGAENRAEGWNTWLTLSFSPTARPQPAALK
jgi:hypothetical protein